MTLRTLIIDDEAIARRRVRRLLREESDIEVVGECGDGQSAIDEIASVQPDLIFLDVQMPGLDGFDVVERLARDRPPAIVFVTAFDRYAMQAFDVHAIDYLLKPFTRDRFRLALQRARERIGMRDGNAGLRALLEQLNARPRYLSRLSVRARGRIVLIDVETIDWLQAADNYVTVHASAREYLLRDTLTTLEDQLDPSVFVRIHRSTIVRLDRIAELQPATHGDFDVRLRDGTLLTLSRTWREQLERALGRAL
jgi:two-component system, LytTR family, response regulator